MPLSARRRGRIASDRLLSSRTGRKFREPADGGFDCSGLTTAAEITLPRTVDVQFRSGPRVPTHSPRYPGTSCSTGTPAHIHHVSLCLLYLGAGLMIDAPDFSQVVKIQLTPAPASPTATPETTTRAGAHRSITQV
jgi:hypothetical protein